MGLHFHKIKLRLNKGIISGFYVGLFAFSVGFSQETNAPIQRPSNLFPTEKIVTRYHNEWTVGSYQRRIEAFKKDIPKFGCTFFIGNSLTQQGGNWNEKFGIECIMNRGIAGDVTDGVLQRLDEIVYYKPKAIFILIGINDLSNLHHDKDTKGMVYDKIIPSLKYVGKNIFKIAKTLHKQLPSCKIFVRTVLPTRLSFLKEDVLTVNSIIEKGEKKGLYSVIDLYSEFVDDSGYLQKDLTNDGVHLNDAGYEKWVVFEKPILKRVNSIGE